MNSLQELNTKIIKILHKNKLLKPLIRAELIKDTLTKISIEENLAKKTKLDFLDLYKLNDEAKLKEWLKDNKLDEDDIEYLSLIDLRLKYFCNDNVSSQLESRFLERKSRLDTYVYSLIRVKNFFKSSEIYYRVMEKEEDFGDLAAKYSEGPEKITRGIIGPSSLEKAHPILIDKLTNLSKGAVQEPFEVEGSYLILRLEYYEPAKLDSSMREEMGKELFNEWIESKVDDLSETLLNKEFMQKKNGEKS